MLADVDPKAPNHVLGLLFVGVLMAALDIAIAERRAAAQGLLAIAPPASWWAAS